MGKKKSCHHKVIIGVIVVAVVIVALQVFNVAPFLRGDVDKSEVADGKGGGPVDTDEREECDWWLKMYRIGEEKTKKLEKDIKTLKSLPGSAGVRTLEKSLKTLEKIQWRTFGYLVRECDYLK